MDGGAGLLGGLAHCWRAVALELARLSLTLTDIPNPDGWDLRVEDMFR